MTLQDRRSFLATLGGGALAVTGCARLGGLIPGARHRHLDRIGIQLYTVRRQAMADLPATLAQIAAIGYKEVEFWGSYPIKPPAISQLFDQNGLVAPSVHVGFPTTPDAFAKIFDDAHAMGHQWITVPSIPAGPTVTVDDWKRVAAQFNEAGARIKAAGFRFAFHNHSEEFKRIGDVIPLDVLIDQTDPALVSFELDIHWAAVGGADPVEYLGRHASRIKMVHVKDSAGPPDFRQTDLSAGTLPWAKILDETTRIGVEHYFVESDTAANPIAFARNGYDYLTHLEF